MDLFELAVARKLSGGGGGGGDYVYKAHVTLEATGGSGYEAIYAPYFCDENYYYNSFIIDESNGITGINMDNINVKAKPGDPVEMDVYILNGQGFRIGCSNQATITGAGEYIDYYVLITGDCTISAPGVDPK